MKNITMVQAFTKFADENQGKIMHAYQNITAKVGQRGEIHCNAYPFRI